VLGVGWCVGVLVVCGVRCACAYFLIFSFFLFTKTIDSKRKLSNELNKDYYRVPADYIFFNFFIGNDFLPNFFNQNFFKARQSSVNQQTFVKLLTYYKQLPGYLTQDGEACLAIT
jgi:5'-3' exonuclease